MKKILSSIAWLSSARAVKCWIRFHFLLLNFNERNPFHILFFYSICKANVMELLSSIYYWTR